MSDCKGDGKCNKDDAAQKNGDLHVLWSNSERFPTRVKWGAVQGKDQILFCKLEI